jgi:DNA-binding transcriptional regulator GbsR (MarR family)
MSRVKVVPKKRGRDHTGSGGSGRRGTGAGIDEVRASLIRDFGRQYVRFGHSELMGRTVGQLLCAEAPLTVDDISERLGVSKSPINEIARRLEELNLVRRIRVPGDRKYYYEIASTVFLQAATNLYRLYEENLRLADSALRAALERLDDAHADRDATRLLCERLIDMREFHRHLVEAYRRFIDEWREAEAELPSVEAYAELLASRHAPMLSGL